MPKKEEPIISLRDITKHYGDVLALRDISFDVQKGVMLAIIGPNGSGKSTLAKIILGLEEANTGMVTIHTKRKTRDIGYVPQRFSFDRTTPITVKEFLELQGCRNKKHEHPETIEQALKQVGASSFINQRLGTLSGGQLQRVLVARALLHEKKILILDEPNANIDVEGEQAMYDLLKKLNKEKCVTIIVVSHELEFVSQYADTVLCVNCSMVCHGDPNKILSKHALDHLYACTTC